jgi:hypothetical protein
MFFIDFGDFLNNPNSDQVFHPGGRARGDYGEPLWRLGSLVPPYRSNGDYHPQSVNFGIPPHLCMPQLSLYPSLFSYAIYFMIAFVLEVISCYHIAAYIV